MELEESFGGLRACLAEDEFGNVVGEAAGGQIGVETESREKSDRVDHVRWEWSVLDTEREEK